ncbi:MAG: hypothetical protein KIT72_11190 [Polyangiaceae bacterium]|nr:hypothetical protein [Polyangiaceae bacterium]
MLALAFVACSDDGGGGGGGGSGASGGNGGTAGNGGSGNAPAYETGGPGTCNGSWRGVNDAYCGEECETDCSRVGQRPVDSCCVLVAEPGRGSGASRFLQRTRDTNDFSDPTGAPPNLSCFTSPGEVGTSKPVTMEGIVEAFSNGCDLSNVKVEVYTVDTDPSSASYRDKVALVGSAVFTDDFDAVPDEDDNCPDDLVQNRSYRYENVPTYTELMVVTSTADASGSKPQWKPLYTYNLYITEEDPDFNAATNVYTRDQRALADSDFQLIPTVAMGSTISRGNGAIGGEVHDCDNIRLQNAMVDIDVSRSIVAYFNDDELKPLPDTGRTQLGTGRTSIWSALNVPPGLARVAATGLIQEDGATKLVTLGHYDIRIFPDAVTSVTFRGRRPFQ